MVIDFSDLTLLHNRKVIWPVEKPGRVDSKDDVSEQLVEECPGSSWIIHVHLKIAIKIVCVW